MPRTNSKTAIVDNDNYTIEPITQGLSYYCISFESNDIAEEAYYEIFNLVGVYEASYYDGDLYTACYSYMIPDVIDCLNNWFNEEVMR